MKLYYYKETRGFKNFGDDMNPWLWDKLLPGMFNEDDSSIFLGVGTILNEHIHMYEPTANKFAVFGSGVGYGNGKFQIDNNWKIYCVRGPLSAKALNLPSNLAITDAAVLIRRVYKCDHQKKYKFSYMPHCANANKIIQQICDDLQFHYIDPTWETEKILSNLTKTETLLTEAMHGAIIADALRVPWIPIRSGPLILSFKWVDWCKSIGLEYKPHLTLPVWAPPENSGVFKKLKCWIKIKMVRTYLSKILKTAHPVLSNDNLIESLTEKMENRLERFKQDMKRGML